MKRLLILSVLALSSCAPLLSAVQGDDATLTRDTGSVVFTAGKTNAEDVAVYLSGPGLTVSGEGVACKVVSSGIGCALGTVPAGKRFRLIVNASPKSGNASFYRPGSARPVLTPLQ